jgi:ABC-2 type transport system permease protein
MSTYSHALADSATMLRRNLRHALRNPSMMMSAVSMPVLFLLLFVYVFGGTLGAGIGTEVNASGEYIDYLAPGILIMTAATGSVAAAVAVCVDMTEGIINRFRTMAIFRGSVLTGHAVACVLQTMLNILIVVGVAVLIGFRPAGDPARWLAAFGMLAALTFAVTWIGVAIGVFAKRIETASNIPLPLMILPFIGSGFVPTESMPTGLRWFAEYQPFTPVMNAVRGLLLDTPVGNDAFIGLAWCAVLALAGYVWARLAFSRGPAR